MFASLESIYPLTNVSRKDLASLCDVLWNWRPCANWVTERPCHQRAKGVACLCQRAETMTPFFDFYREVTAFYVPELACNSNPALRTHDDLRRIVQYIKDRPDDTRLQLTKQHFEKCTASNPKRLPSNDQNRAFNIAARIMTMLTCSTEGQSDGLLEAGSQPTPWYNDQSFNQFINSAISKQNTVAFELHDSAPLSMKLPPGSITAKRLRKLAKLKIIPTNDLRNHLLLDETGGTVSIYHYTSILRQQLRAYQDGDVQKGSGPTTGQ